MKGEREKTKEKSKIQWIKQEKRQSERCKKKGNWGVNCCRKKVKYKGRNK